MQCLEPLMKNIVIFASGAGSNAAAIIRHFSHHEYGRVTAVFCNKSDAGVLEIARDNHIPSVVFSRHELLEGGVLQKLHAFRPDLIVLAGFLLRVPEPIVEQYRGKIINIHPSLLPKFGGKGMYGMHVHQAVVDHREAETGITIHYVDEHYDEGDVIAQYKVDVDPNDTCDRVAEKVRQLEHSYFPSTIESLL